MGEDRIGGGHLEVREHGKVPEQHHLFVWRERNDWEMTMRAVGRQGVFFCGREVRVGKSVIL